LAQHWTLALVASAVLFIGASPPSHPAAGECSSETGGASVCLYRSLAPSVGIVVSCRDEHRCRVGYYYGNATDVVWFTPPPGLSVLPRPEVSWLTATLAQVRVDCGRRCSWSYFFEARRRRLSAPHFSVLAVDPRRFLLAAVEDRALLVRQLFSGREVLRLERQWTPADWLGDVISAIHFDPDGRLSFTWLRGNERLPVSERVSVPPVPHS
jgi:hypothetical protein